MVARQVMQEGGHLERHGTGLVHGIADPVDVGTTRAQTAPAPLGKAQ